MARSVSGGRPIEIRSAGQPTPRAARARFGGSRSTDSMAMPTCGYAASPEAGPPVFAVPAIAGPGRAAAAVGPAPLLGGGIRLVPRGPYQQAPRPDSKHLGSTPGPERRRSWHRPGRARRRPGAAPAPPAAVRAAPGGAARPPAPAPPGRTGTRLAVKRVRQEGLAALRRCFRTVGSTPLPRSATRDVWRQSPLRTGQSPTQPETEIIKRVTVLSSMSHRSSDRSVGPR